MASTTTPQPAYSLLFNTQRNEQQHHFTRGRHITRRPSRRNTISFGVFAASKQQPRTRPQAPPGVDTRIHWDNEDEGWVGGGSKKSQTTQEEPETLLGDKFADLLNESTDSHYQFLGIPVDADLEEIKAAYRKLSKEYHPDTTSLPLKAASDKFLKLREIYDVLSDQEKRKFYDWTLAQEAASRQAEKMRVRLEDPYEVGVRNEKSIPDMVDRLGGRNMELSDQAKTALGVDILAFLFAIGCFIYAYYFKQPY
ncbi:hypothetical protein Tsubulata_030275 [Turnera subulata]|uniref:J domain-containing protein n=1 Tax=Turnera subulata TaxID=218843 RepID=A0A9Q0FWL8_9ROSI|nr:hypothetical protein Tsubulata_030275 [Turnera subulata]